MDTLSTIVNLSSITCLKELTDKQIKALQDIGIIRVSELLNYDPIKNAKLLMALASGDVTVDITKSNLLKDPTKNISEIPNLPISELVGITVAQAKKFTDNFLINTIEEFASFKPFTDAERLVFKFSNEFSEPASAPEELMPAMIGNVQSSANFTSFIKEKTIKFNGLELVYDEQRNYVDVRLASLFPVHGFFPLFNAGNRLINFPTFKPPVPEIQLGFITKMTQRWINVGTHLGEVIHSLPLAPGESRNIAVIDWKRKQSTSRTEDTTASEKLTNELFHKRALDEVTRSTANEHQFGGTDIAAGTVATAGAGVVGAALAGGIAGTLPGAAIGALAGAGTGGVAIPGVGAIPGAGVGALAGAVIGFGVGASISGGAALIGAANAQLGTVHSDSSGERGIVGSLSQNISETSIQKASSLRSLWSTVVVTDEQAENEKLSTRNVTNYNHSHALTIQYYEVLQHYKSEITLAAAEPILYLPFKPLEFTIDFISDYWHILSHGIRNINLRKEFDVVINGIKTEEELGSPKIEYVNVQILTGGFLGGVGGILGNIIRVNLSGIQGNKSAFNNTANFSFSEPVDAELLKGVQLLQMFPGDSARVFVRTGLVTANNTRNIVSRESNLQTANSNGILNFDFTVTPSDGLLDDVLARKADEIERYFNSHRYFFTRLLLLSLEKEQLIDLVESLMLRASIQVSFPRPNPGRIIPTFPTSPFVSRDRSITEALTNSTQNILHATISDLLSSSNISPDNKKSLAIEIADTINSEINSSSIKNVDDKDEKKKLIDSIKSNVDDKLSKVQGLSTPNKNEIHQKISTIINSGLTNIGKINLSDSIHLSEFIDTTPLAIAGNTLIFKMKKVVDPEVLNNNLVKNDRHVKAVIDYPQEISDFIEKAITDGKEKLKFARNADIYLPTSGVFAEAILGRANASEKIDITRFFNWQDSPIPHLAPAINPISSGSRQSGQLEGTGQTLPGNVLNIVNPSTFPDPTGLTAVLSAIQNGNIFRDMSKSDQLVTVMSNLSNLAQSMANQAGSLAGQAQVEALKSATDIGKAVAQLAQQSGSQPANLPTNPTSQGAASNALEKILGSTNGNIPQSIDDFKKILGVSPATQIPQANDLFKTKGDVSSLLNDFAKSGVGELKFNNAGGENLELKSPSQGNVVNAGLIDLGSDELPSNIDFWKDVFTHNVPQNILTDLEGRGFKVQTLSNAQDTSGLLRAALNLDFYQVRISEMPAKANGDKFSVDELLLEIRKRFSELISTDHIDDNPFTKDVALLTINDVKLINTGVPAQATQFTGLVNLTPALLRLNTIFGPVDDSHNDEQKWLSNNPIGAVMNFHSQAGENMGVVASKFENTSWTFSTIGQFTQGFDFDFSRITGPIGTHPVSGNRMFGITKNSSGDFIFFTKGADRTSGIGETLISEILFVGGHAIWLSLQAGISNFVNSNSGKAEVIKPFSDRFEYKKALEHFGGIDI
jgi:hypothetical protein